MKNTGNAEMVPDDDNKSIYPLHFDAKISVNGTEHTVRIDDKYANEICKGHYGPIDVVASTTNLEDCTDVHGEKIFRNKAEADQFRISTLNVQPTISNDNTLLYRLPTQESLRDQQLAESQGKKNALTFYEPIRYIAVPQVPLRPPKGSDPSRYVLPKAESTSTRIYHFLKYECKCLVYREEIYGFDRETKLYKQLTISEVKRLASTRFQSDFIKEQGTKSADRAIDLLMNDHEVQVDHPTVESTWWVFRNGILDIVSMQLMDNSDGRYFVLGSFHCDFNFFAQCPKFDAFIMTAMHGDRKAITRLWQTIGYILSPDYSAKKIICYVGKKDTGKSLLIRVLSYIIGEENIAHITPNDFSSQFALAELANKRINICSELANVKLTESAVQKMKALTGGDSLQVDRKFKEGVVIRPEIKFLFGSNFPIIQESADPNFSDRLVYVCFNNPIPPEKQNRQLDKELEEEASGIVNKAIMAYKDFVSKGYIFEETDDVLLSQEEWNLDLMVKDFLELNYKTDVDASFRISSADLYQDYIDYCGDNNYPAILQQRDFTREVEKIIGNERYSKCRIEGEPCWGFKGIKRKEVSYNDGSNVI